MTNKCAECLLFQGQGKCGAGKSTFSNNAAAAVCTSFKAPASVFSGKKCGGCRLFAGAGKCNAGKTTYSANGNAMACASYAPAPG